VTRAPFGTTPTGDPVEIFTLTNASGLVVRATNYGGIIVSLWAPDRSGELADIVLGYDTLDGYLDNVAYFGAIVGRYANRIAHARFTLNGTTYQLAANEGSNHLHGGRRGFDKAVWRADPQRAGSAVGLVLQHTSPDGDEGYPGTLQVRVAYTLTEANDLIVDYHATADQATPINLTQHSYFNLAGAGRSDVLGHVLQLEADAFTPVDEQQIPTGAIVPVAGTPFDFRAPVAIGARIARDDEQLRQSHGYDHNYVLTRVGPGLVPAARVTDPASGRTLLVSTTEPGIQVYCGNGLGDIIGKEDRRYPVHGGLCLETQHFPDSPNQPSFPSTILRPDVTWRSRTVFSFAVA